MMWSRVGWPAAAVVGYGAVLFALYGIAAMKEAGAIPWRLAHTLSYCALGVALLGALARQLPRTQPHVWRLLTLIVGAVVAGAGLWFTQPALRAPASFDAWMAALLGLAVTAMLPRWLPTAITRRWLGIERRQRARP